MSERITEQEQFAQLERDGWTKINAPQGFTHHVGPYWRKSSEQGVIMGLVVGERHTNTHLGTIHGGVVMTFADIGLGSGIAHILGADAHRCVTAGLNTQFVSVARVGEFISVEPEIVRQTSQLIFVRGLIKCGEKTIASADGIWKLLASSN